MVNDIDAAAQWLLTRLRDPELRGYALLEIQDYADTSMPPRAKELRARRKNLNARQDVHAAVGAVGRRETFHIASEED
jgi:hypothetical protein